MLLNGLASLQIGFGVVSTDVAFLSSIAIIVGAVFVIFQLRDDKELIKATMLQAAAAADQAKLSMKQLFDCVIEIKLCKLESVFLKP